MSCKDTFAAGKSIYFVKDHLEEPSFSPVAAAVPAPFDAAFSRDSVPCRANDGDIDDKSSRQKWRGN